MIFHSKLLNYRRVTHYLHYFDWAIFNSYVTATSRGCTMKPSRYSTENTCKVGHFLNLGNSYVTNYQRVNATILVESMSRPCLQPTTRRYAPAERESKRSWESRLFFIAQINVKPMGCYMLLPSGKRAQFANCKVTIYNT